MTGTRGVLFLTGALFLAACGGGEPPPSNPNTPPLTPASSSGAAPAAASTDPAAGTAAPASAGPWPTGSGDDKAAQMERLKKDPGPLKSNWEPPGKGDRYGHAEGLINAAPDKVKAKLTDYTHYSELAGSKFKKVNVVDKQGANTDVYFQLPIMKGVVVIWYVTSFSPPKSANGGDMIEGTFVKGNIKGMNVAFTVRPGPDANSSVMVCDLLLQPNVPAPQSALDEELRDACGDAINNVKKLTAAP